MLDNLAAHRDYYDIYDSLSSAKTSISVKKFRALMTAERKQEESAERLRDCLHFMASLTAVDGALVVTDSQRVLGFGAEVVAQSPMLREILLAANAAGTETRRIPIESYGTRHRSAFRFCSSYENSLAFVISQDGGIKATKRIGAEVMLWPDVQIGTF
jgi:hypothetical protein